jgi:hypothetical protein
MTNARWSGTGLLGVDTTAVPMHFEFIYKEALKIDPHYANARWFMALSLEQKGDLPQARAKLEMAGNLTGGSDFLALLGRACALIGETGKAINAYI